LIKVVGKLRAKQSKKKSANKNCGLSLLMNGVIGKSLIVCGTLITLYALIPTLAWIGFGVSTMGFFFVVSIYHDRVSKQGLRAFIPAWVDNYLTREDMVEELVRWIRDNGTFSKIARLVLIKFLDLSKDELVEVISGIWPQYRSISRSGHETVTLMEISPVWFRDMYLPKKALSAHPQNDPTSPIHPAHLPILPLSDTDPQSVTEQSNTMLPLLLWLAEKRIRSTLQVGVPVAGKFVSKTVAIAIASYVLWRRVPRSRRPMKITIGMISALYVLSITKGLPGFFEKLFKSIGFTQFRTIGGRNISSAVCPPNAGSFERVMYALLEPLIPTVNLVDDHHRIEQCKSSLPPNSPCWSQASTNEPLNISIHVDE
jgi:hypothetical protein